MQNAVRQCRDVDYPEVKVFGVAHLCALGVETFGRWAPDSLDIVNRLAKECCEGLPPRIAMSSRQRLLRRWWGLLGVATQRVVARALIEDSSADLDLGLVESIPPVEDW